MPRSTPHHASPLRYPALAAVLMLLSLAALALAGCGGSSAEASDAEAQAAGPPRVTVVNQSTGPIRAVAVKANLMLSFRDLKPGESSTLSDRKLTVPSRIGVRWTDHTGQHHYTRCDTGDLGRNPASVRFVIDQAHNANLGP